MANTRECSVTQDHTKLSGDLVDFPWLWDENIIPSEFGTSAGSYWDADGGSLRTYANSGATGETAREIATWASGSQEIWVTSTLSSVSNTTYYMQYGDGTLTDYAVTDTYGRNNTWNTSYRIVSHLISASTPVDVTGNGHTGSTTYTSTITGQIKGGLYINNGGSGNVSFASAEQDSNHTVECWVKPANTTSDSLLTMANGVDSTTRDRSILIDSSGYFNYYIYSPTAGAGKTAVGATAATTNWTYLAGVEDGTNAIIYVNGSNDGSIACVDSYAGYSTPEWDMGAVASVHSPSYYDEFRVSNGARSASWLLACYNNQNSPSTFATAGTPGAAPSGGATTWLNTNYWWDSY